MAVLQGGPKGRTVTGVRCKDRLTGKLTLTLTLTLTLSLSLTLTG